MIHNYLLFTKINEMQKLREKRFNDFMETTAKMKNKENDEITQDTNETTNTPNSDKDTEKDLTMTQEEIDNKAVKNLLYNNQKTLEEELLSMEKNGENLNLNSSLYTSCEPYYNLEDKDSLKTKEDDNNK